MTEIQTMPMYVISIEYCDGEIYQHDHASARDAAEEYADLVRALIREKRRILTGEQAQDRHIRRVIKTRTTPGRYHPPLDTGIWECDHQPDLDPHELEGIDA